MSAIDRTVGVVGLGLIGSAVARRLLEAGFEVAGYDIDGRKREALAALGGAPAASLAELAQAADRFVLAVFDTQQVEDVIEGRGALLDSRRDGSHAVYVCVSTCDPDRIRSLGERISARGATLLECPLSGTSEQVSKGDALGLVAGDEARLEAVEDIVAAICKRHTFVGALGSGNKTKLAINLILGLNRAALAEGLVFAEQLGLPLDRFLDVARSSAAWSQVMDVKGAKMLARDFTPHGRIVQSHKDFSLILAAADSAGQELPLASLYRSLMQDNIDHGEADLDNSAIIEAIRRRRSETGAP
jgi:3-hydroxyisobutyrate dehydrogenase-like beta-hydroxyacid dehydrogenase